MPDPITEPEVKFKLAWSADLRTRRSIVRQTKLMNFKTPTAYLLQLIAATIASNEEDTYVVDGRLVNGCELDWDPS